VSDGPGQLPTWPQVRTFGQYAEAVALDSVWVCDHLLSGPPDQGIQEGWTILAADRLVAAIDPRYRALVLVAALIGMRWGELVALRWDDRLDQPLDDGAVRGPGQLRIASVSRAAPSVLEPRSCAPPLVIT
jgi:hypothetical protein